MSSLQIRAAAHTDATLVLSLIRELAEYERLAHEVSATEDAIRESLFGATPRAEALIADLDGTPVGFALFFHNYSTFLGRHGLYLEDLFVRPAARGRGAGKALLAAVAALAVERGCGRLDWNVLAWNKPAIDFYTSLGAREMSDWRVFRLTGAALAALGATHRR